MVAKSHSTLTDEKAARMMVALRGGRTLNKFGVRAPRLDAYFKAHLEYAQQARPLIEANNAAAAARKLAAFDLARLHSAERRRNAETCANGHVRTLENTFYVQNERQCLVRRCKDCNQQARAIRMPKPEDVRGAVTALHHGQTLTSLATPYLQKLLRNFILKNPNIGNRMHVLSKKNADANRSDFNQSRRLVAASALLRNDGEDAYDAVMRATAHLHEDDRGDVTSRMYVAIGEGRLKLSDARARVGEFLKDQRRRPRVYGDARYSLDNPLGDDSNATWLDTKTDANRLWG
jgi:hypothetical protein